MIVLAMVLLVLVVVFSVAIVVSNPGVYELSIFRVLIPVTSAGVYFTGIGASVLAVLALWLLRTGVKRSREQRNRLRMAETTKPPEIAPGPATQSPSRAPESSLDPSSGTENGRDEDKKTR